MGENTKIKSVIEIAKYKAGDDLWWVLLEPKGHPNIEIKPGDEWMADHHPKVLYDRGMAKKVWGLRSKPPRMCASDYMFVFEILTHTLLIGSFKVKEIIRCQNTGEFFYGSENEEWLPESCLFRTVRQAEVERKRILRMFKSWLDQHG